ncbi:FkbM family methyltransferase [Mycobacterium sp. B14F4]|uniref:FkbM family methyltransferase n=1 Tax=Mycobacterium sp. B14F4 TaxID=3153565 RepID=UPI00325DAE4D
MSADAGEAFTLNLSLIGLRARKLVWLARRPERRGLLRHRIAPSIEHNELLEGRSFRSVVDVGANVGQFAIWAADVLAAERVVCIEPLPAAIELLRKVVPRLAPCRVEVIAGALSAAPGHHTLHVTAAIDSSSLLPTTATAQSRTALHEAGTQEVEVFVGDDVLPNNLPRPLLVKLDVQGTELDVLAGMPKLLSAADAVLVEVSFEPLYEGQSDPSAVVAHLLDAGFSLTGAARVPGADSSWSLHQADLLFERR